MRESYERGKQGNSRWTVCLGGTNPYTSSKAYPLGPPRPAVLAAPWLPWRGLVVLAWLPGSPWWPLGVSALFIFYTLIVSLRFGERETASLFASWAAAYLYTAILLEPGVICIISALPCLVSEETYFGRCFIRVKWCWDELLSP